MGQRIENNIYSAIKMRKGHRRTQSDITHFGQRTTAQPIQQPSQSISNLQIAKLLTICNQKVKQKVSNVEVLSPPAQNSCSMFQFGHNTYKKTILFTENDYDGDYLACIPQRKQSSYQDCEKILPYFHRRAQLKNTKPSQLFDEKFRRLPFSDALNNKPRERRKAGPEKTRESKRNVRSWLDLKIKF